MFTFLQMRKVLILEPLLAELLADFSFVFAAVATRKSAETILGLPLRLRLWTQLQLQTQMLQVNALKKVWILPYQEIRDSLGFRILPCK